MLRTLTATLRRIARYLRGADAPSEEDSERDGVFSHATEFHAFLVAAGAGQASLLLHRPELAGAVIVVALGAGAADRAGVAFNGVTVRELQAEPWYAVGGVLVGRYLLPILGRALPI